MEGTLSDVQLRAAGHLLLPSAGCGNSTTRVDLGHNSSLSYRTVAKKAECSLAGCAKTDHEYKRNRDPYIPANCGHPAIEFKPKVEIT